MALEVEIAAYDKARVELERLHLGKFAVFHESELIGLFDSLDAAATEATERFGRGPFLIRQVGQRPLVLPVSVYYRAVSNALG